MNARLDGVNAELSDKKKMSTAALIDELHGLPAKEYEARKEVIDELYARHVVNPIPNPVIRKDAALGLTFREALRR